MEEKERKEEAARYKKVIDRAYKDTSQAVSDRKSILFKKIFTELLTEYQEEEEAKKKIYIDAASDE